jgi:hypothetical protein
LIAKAACPIAQPDAIPFRFEVLRSAHGFPSLLVVAEPVEHVLTF